jgi:hypothetical protein
MKARPPIRSSIPTDPLSALADPLTPAQREFALVLGNLLADRWDHEQVPSATPSANFPPTRLPVPEDGRTADPPAES